MSPMGRSKTLLYTFYCVVLYKVKTHKPKNNDNSKEADVHLKVWRPTNWPSAPNSI